MPVSCPLTSLPSCSTSRRYSLRVLAPVPHPHHPLLVRSPCQHYLDWSHSHWSTVLTGPSLWLSHIAVCTSTSCCSVISSTANTWRDSCVERGGTREPAMAHIHILTHGKLLERASNGSHTQPREPAMALTHSLTHGKLLERASNGSQPLYMFP